MTLPPDRPLDLVEAPAPGLAARDLRMLPQGSAPLSPDEQAFNRLVSILEDTREQLAEWRVFEERYRQLTMGKLMPLQEQFRRARRDLILQCDDILAGRRGGGVAGKVERRDLEAFLIDTCLVHLEEHGDDPPVLDAHDRYARVRFEDRLAHDQGDVHVPGRESSGNVTDRQVAGGSTAELSAEPWLQAEDMARREFEAREAARGRRREERTRRREAGRAAAAEQTAKAASQSVRQVYRKLASALHPDRARDAADRERRHEHMQRANAAHEAADLLGLLTLQLEIEQIDADHLATISQVQLLHYNQVLRDQVADLERELQDIASHYAATMSEVRGRVTPMSVERDLRHCIAEVRRDAEALRQHALAMLDPAFRREWLSVSTRSLRT